MSPPIYTPDGSEVSEIVLPDGSTASEVTDPDGNVVFEAGPDIPDSVDYQWDPSTYATGDSSWVDDVQNESMSITGDPQKTTLSNGNEAVSWDGEDDFGHATLSPEYLQNSFALEFELQYSHSNEGEHIFGVSDGTYEFFVSLNEDPVASTDTGSFSVRVTENSNNFEFGFSNNPSLNDGNRHLITISVDDASNNNATLIVDGTERTVNTHTAGSPSLAELTTDMGFGGRNTDGTTDLNAQAKLGKTRFHGSSQSSQTIN